jgi:Zn-dependent alcohol dehydrogenase
METRAAVPRHAGTPSEITELELDPPPQDEVLVRMEAAGLGHSDEHIRARGRAWLWHGLWHERHIKLTELITKKYPLDEINEGYQDLMEGKNIRGVIVHQH